MLTPNSAAAFAGTIFPEHHGSQPVNPTKQPGAQSTRPGYWQTGFPGVGSAQTLPALQDRQCVHHKTPAIVVVIAYFLQYVSKNGAIQLVGCSGLRSRRG